MWGRGAENRTRGRRRASEAEGNLRLLEAPFGSHGFFCFFWLVKDFQRSAHRLGSAGNAVICLSMIKHLEEERTTALLIAWSRWSVLLFRPIYFRTAEMNSLLVADVLPYFWSVLCRLFFLLPLFHFCSSFLAYHFLWVSASLQCNFQRFSQVSSSSSSSSACLTAQIIFIPFAIALYCY